MVQPCIMRWPNREIIVVEMGFVVDLVHDVSVVKQGGFQAGRMSFMWFTRHLPAGAPSATRNAYLTARQAICLQFRGP